MLVLTRKEGERITLGGSISVVVVKCKRGHVRLGIEAPDGVRILRGELWDRLHIPSQRATIFRRKIPGEDQES